MGIAVANKDARFTGFHYNQEYDQQHKKEQDAYFMRFRHNKPRNRQYGTAAITAARRMNNDRKVKVCMVFLL